MVPKVHLLVLLQIFHFPRKTRLQLEIKFPDQHTKPDLKHNNSKTRPRVLQNTEKMHPRPTPHRVGVWGQEPIFLYCQAGLWAGISSFPLEPRILSLPVLLKDLGV